MKYPFIFCLALLTGCSSVANQPEYKLPYDLSDQIIKPLSCNQFDVCSALYLKNTRPRTLKIAVSGEYHSIKSATIWIDNQAYALTPTIGYTSNGVTQGGKRVSMRPFSAEQPLREKLKMAKKVFLEVHQQSTFSKTLMKDENFSHPLWRALLAGLD